jgi:hypothetical protein
MFIFQLKKLYHFVLCVAGLGFALIIYKVYSAMWATDPLVVICVGIAISCYWLNMVLDYYDNRIWKKYLTTDKK